MSYASPRFLGGWRVSELCEHLVYQAVVDHPGEGVAELAHRLNLPEDRVRSALDQLASIALLSWSGEGRPALTSVAPSVAMDVIVARYQAQVSEQQASLASTRTAVETWLSARRVPEDDSSSVERIGTLEGVRLRIDEIAAECREEFWSLNPDGAQTPDNIASSRPPNLSLLERGITMKSVFNDSASNDLATAEHLRWLSDHGADVRTAPMLSMRMLVVDREIALVPIDDRDTSVGAFLVRGRGLVAGLTTLFLTTWRAATPLGVRRPRDPQRPTPTEKQALILWGIGCTDAVVARRLGVSERTVRRLSETLAQRLGARSRFEMGLRAAELGWITGDDLSV